MSFPEFGEIVEKSSGYFPEFGEVVQPISRGRSLASAFPKGVIKALGSISPLPKTGPVPEKLGHAVTEQFLPTQEKAPEQFLERAGKLSTFLAGGEGTLASKGLRTGAGALFGQGVKEVGGGELAQDIAELGAMSLPDLAKSIPAKKAQERILGFLRKKGFTENEITPLVQDPKKLSRYAKFASKGEKTNKLMRDIYGKFDNVYSSIRQEAESLSGLSGSQTNDFIAEFQKKMDRIPKFYKRQIKEEIEDLVNSEMKFNDFMDFDQAVNARIGGVTGGKAILGTLKEATANAKKSISPELFNDNSLANELYGKRINVTDHLRTRQIDDLIDLGEAGSLLAGLADQNLGIISKVLGISGGRLLAREMLINPKLQNVSLRILHSLKKNKLPVAFKLYDIFRDEAIKKNKELQKVLPED